MLSWHELPTVDHEPQMHITPSCIRGLKQSQGWLQPDCGVLCVTSTLFSASFEVRCLRRVYCNLSGLAQLRLGIPER